MLIYFCIVVHNGTGHILLLDFIWAHPNSLDWPIKSSRPTKVCNVQYIYIYIYRDVFAFFGWASFLLFESSPGKHTHTLHFGLNFGRQGKSSLIAHSRTITHPESRLLDIKGEQKWLLKAWTKVTDWILLLNACLIVNMWSYAI